MTDQTNIEWADSTFNPWLGCTKVSPACDHCYAEKLVDTRMHKAKWGPGQPRVRTSVANWRKPLQWNARADEFRQCDVCGWRGERKPNWAVCPTCNNGIMQPARRRVFCASLADVFDNEVPIEWLVDLLDLIRRTPNLDWLLLTKRIGNVEKRLTKAHQHILRKMVGSPLWAVGMRVQDWLGGNPPANVWLGATICNQEEADRDIPKLLASPARVRFVSIEPMLGPIDLNATPPVAGTRPVNGATIADISGCLPKWQTHPMRAKLRGGLDWIIAGGESGPHARPSHPDWFRSLRDQCATAGVPFLFKQWGNWRPISEGGTDWYASLYRSNRIAESGSILEQMDLDEAYGRTCKVATAAIHADGSAHDPVEPGAWQAGTRAMLTFNVGKRKAGRLLDGVEHNQFPQVTP